MKNKTTIVMAAILLFLTVISFSVYAAFVMINNYEASISYNEIKNQTLTTDAQSLSITFAEPGDNVSYTYSLTNSDETTYSYYYKITLDDNTEYTKLFDMIYVYQNDLYCGVLSEFAIEGNKLPLSDYIFDNETRTMDLKFELHNGASNYINETINFKISCFIENTNPQKVLFAETETEFEQVILDANRSKNKTIVIKDDIATTKTYNLNSNITLDLCGNNLSLGQDIILGENTNLKITDSRDNGGVSGSNFVVNSTTSFIELETSVNNITATNYNSERLLQIIEDNNIYNYIVCGTEYDFIGFYSVYNISVTSSDVEITNGVIDDLDVVLSTNKIITVNFTALSSTNELEYKYIGNDETVITNILNEYLYHLNKFMEADNGIQLTTNLYLPTLIEKYNATINWSTSDDTIMNNDGVSQTEQGNVTLTATIKIFDNIYIQKYYVYVVQQDNLTKLQYLAAQVEKGTTLTLGDGSELLTDMTLSVINEIKPLPIAGSDYKDNYNYYTNWTNGKDLGILELYYELESAYFYITPNLTQESGDGHIILDKVLSDAGVSLNQITYSKVARIKIIGYFDNGEQEETYITISINLSASELAEEVFADVQEYLNNVDVLKNILKTRDELGIVNESGDFPLKTEVDVVKLTYTSLDTDLYSIVEEEGQLKVHFNDLKYLELTDTAAKIQANIVVKSDEEYIVSSTKVLSFGVPAAITTTNFNYLNNESESIPIFDFTSINNKNIFYSIKHQVLQQYNPNVLYDENTYLKDITNIETIYSNLGEYILIDDIKKADQLVFEYGDEICVMDYYDLSILELIISWARSEEKIKVSDDTTGFKAHIDSGLRWISSDGSSNLSDGEIKIILSYCERYPGFMNIWNEKINVGDNILSDNDINNLLETLASDKDFISILNWITDDSSTSLSLLEWYQTSNDSLTQEELMTNLSLPETIVKLTNNGESSVTDNEERVIVYYVLSKQSAKYEAFYTAWKEAISRQNDQTSYVKDETTIENIKDIKLHSLVSFLYATESDPKTLNSCYDPIFAKILEWANYGTKANSDETSITLKSYLDQTGISISEAVFTFDGSSYLSQNATWEYLYVSGWIGNSDNQCNETSEAEWTVIYNYLKYYGITSVTIGDVSYSLADVNVNTESDLVVKHTVSASALGNSGSASANTLSFDFMNALIGAINEKYTESIINNINNCNSWIKSEDKTIVPWTEIITNVEIDTLDDCRIKDGFNRVSKDEYEVITALINNQFAFMDNTLLDLFISYHVANINMEISVSEFTDTTYKNVLNTIDQTQEFEDTIILINNLYKGESPSTGSYDNLDTVSEDEFRILAELYKENNNFINALNAAVSLFTATVDGNLVLSITKDNQDMTLTDEDLYGTESVKGIYSYINEELDNTDSSKAYKYITISQIKNLEYKTFEILKYFENLKVLVVKGNSSNFLFASNDVANKVFDIISNSVGSLTKLTMNYCGVSNIEQVTNLINLVSLDLRGNYKYLDYDGLEDISPLILLMDNKSINNILQPFLFLHVGNTNVTFKHSEVVLATIYSKNNKASLWYEYEGFEVMYSPGELNSDQLEAITLCSLLYEIGTLNNSYILLPQYAYSQTSPEGKQITWRVEAANGLVRYDSVTNKIIRLSSDSGSCTISAKITVGSSSYTRYFVISLN